MKEESLLKTNRAFGAALACATILLLLGACVGPQGKSQDSTSFWLKASLPAKPGYRASAPTVLVSPMRAHPGFDTPRMAYTREPNQLAYYAYNRWVEAPARLLTPLVTQALEASSAFGAVVQAPGTVHAALRLDTELVSITQDFSARPSRMHLVVRAQLADAQNQTIRASRTFSVQAVAASEDARGGAEAANQMLPELLAQLADWAAQASAQQR